jgi:hypothetical protein
MHIQHSYITYRIHIHIHTHTHTHIHDSFNVSSPFLTAQSSAPLPNHSPDSPGRAHESPGRAYGNHSRHSESGNGAGLNGGSAKKPQSESESESEWRLTSEQTGSLFPRDGWTWRQWMCPESESEWRLTSEQTVSCFRGMAGHCVLSLTLSPTESSRLW